MSEEIQVQVNELKTQASGLVRWAEGLEVRTAGDVEAASAQLNTAAKIKKAWLSYWKPIKDGAKKTHSDICAKEKELTDIIDRARAVADSKILAWRRAEREKAEAEQRRLQAEADAKARKERERLEKEAAKLKTPEKREERLAQAAAVVAPVVTVAAPVVVTPGASTRETWVARVVDMAALIAAATPGSVAASFLLVNQSAADAFARSTKGAVAVSGVVYEKVTSIARRSV